MIIIDYLNASDIEYFFADKPINRVSTKPEVENKKILLENLKNKISMTQNCELKNYADKLVFNDGDSDSAIMIVGEGPGQKEDIEGKPFVGDAGLLLNKMLKSINIDRDKVYITNVVNYRPPNNRKPSLEEVKSCIPWLDKQIDFLDPKIIVLAGSTAVESFLNIKQPISKIRGEWIEKDDIKVMPIFHPSYLLRNPSKQPGKPKWLTWQDLKKVKKVYDSF